MEQGELGRFSSSGNPARARVGGVALQLGPLKFCEIRANQEEIPIRKNQRTQRNQKKMMACSKEPQKGGTRKHVEGHRIAAGLCLGWVVSCLRFCSRMNQKWPCVKSQKSTTRLWISGQARARSGWARSRIRRRSRSKSRPCLAELESGTSNGMTMTGAQTNKTKRRANQAVACPSLLVGGDA